MDSPSNVVRVFPRRKALRLPSVRGTQRSGVQLRYSTLALLFHLPQIRAASSMELSLTAFKSACRRLGITRWPYERTPRPRAVATCDEEVEQEQVPAPIRWEDEDATALDPEWIAWFVSAGESAGLS
eukprot:560644-Hanusia_phi.AAC.2